MIRRQFLQMTAGGIGLAAIDNLADHLPGFVARNSVPQDHHLHGTYSSATPPFLRQDIETFFVASISGRMGRPIRLQSIDSPPPIFSSADFAVVSSTLTNLPSVTDLSRELAINHLLSDEDHPITNPHGDIVLPLAVGSNQFLAAFKTKDPSAVSGQPTFISSTRVNQDIHGEIASLRQGQIDATAYFSPLSWIRALQPKDQDLELVLSPTAMPTPILVAVWNKDSWQRLEAHQAMIRWWSRYTLFVSSNGWQERQMEALAELRLRYSLRTLDVVNPNTAKILT